MALVLNDRVKEGSTSTGTGSISLLGSAARYVSFGSVMGDGDTTYYVIAHTLSGVDEWEIGLGTWNTGATLDRTTILSSSNSGSAVNFSAGNKDVFITYPSAIAAFTDGSGDLSSLIGLGNHSTTDVVEGNNLYYTNARVDTEVDSHLSGGTGVTYNAGAISIGQAVATTSNVTFNTVTLGGNPATALQAATKEYVDTIAAAGIHYHELVRVEAASNRPSTYDNGTSGVGATLTNSGTQEVLVIDGVTVDVADRVLLQQQTNSAHNGIYTVTNVGSASTNWVLTRAVDADSYHVSDKDALGEGDAFFIKEGLVSAGDLYVMNTSGVITFGTTPITFTVIAETAIYTAGTGLTLTGTEIATVQDIATGASPTFVTVNANLSGNVTGNVTGELTGNAATATKLATARAIALSGDVTGTANFDGTAGITITATVVDDSHAHVIANVDGLQDALDAKADDSTTISAGSGLTGGGAIGSNQTISHADTSAQESLTALTGADVVSDIDLDTYGHVTALATRTMTLANLGYTGATNANYITNNTELTNGSAYITSTASITGNAATATTFETARTINGVSFNGSADITVDDSTKLPLAGGTMTGSLRHDHQAYTASGGTLTIDLSTANHFIVTMTAATTFAFTNKNAGRFGNIVITEDATGGYSFTLPSECKTPAAGAAIVQQTGANSVSIIAYHVLNSNNILVNYIGNFA